MITNRTIQKRPWKLVVLLATFALLAASCGGDTAADTTTAATPAPMTDGAATTTPAPATTTTTTIPDRGVLRIAQVGFAITQSIIGVAMAGGFFEDEGFSDVQQIATGAGGSAVAALLAGDADLGVMGSSEVISTIALGEELVFLGALYKGFPVFVSARTEWVEEKGLSPSDPLEDRVRAMEGANIGTLGEGSTVTIFSRFILESVGLDYQTDAQLIPFDGVASIVAAFQTNAIDLMPLANPFTAQMVAEGIGVTILGGTEFPEFVGFVQNGITARPSDVAADPERYEAIWRAMRKAHKLILEDPDTARDLLQTFFETIDDDVFKSMWEIETDPASGPVYATALDPVLTPEDLQKVIEFRNVEGLNAADFIDTSILEKVIAEEG